MEGTTPANQGAKPRIQSGTTQGVPIDDGSANGAARQQQQKYNPASGRRNPGAHTRAKPPQVRKVNDFIVFMDDVLGEGQYGKVCKAQLAVDLLQTVNGSK